MAYELIAESITRKGRVYAEQAGQGFHQYKSEALVKGKWILCGPPRLSKSMALLQADCRTTVPPEYCDTFKGTYTPPPQTERNARAAAPEPKAPKAPTEAKRPKAGTLTGKAWDILDELTAKHGRPATIVEAMPLAKALTPPLNESTMRTQYAAWRKFNGVEAPGKSTK